MPFDFLKRKKAPDAATPPAAAARRPRRRASPFDGLTEDWRLVGRMMIDGRLSDALNKREPIDDRRRPAGRRSTAPSRWRRRPVSSRSIRTTWSSSSPATIRCRR